MDPALPGSTADPQSCANCGTSPLLGPHCHSCGQRVPGRVTFRSISGRLWGQLSELDFAALRTLRHATLHPGRVALEYVDGRRTYYSNPLAYALAAATVYAVSLAVMDFEPLIDVSSASGPSEFWPAMVAALGPGIAYLTLLALLPAAWLQRLLVGRRSRHSSAECYILLLFVWAQGSLIAAAIVLSGYYATTVGFVLSGVVGVAYPAWGLKEFHDLEPHWALGTAFVLFWVTVYVMGFVGGFLIYLRGLGP